MDGWMDGRGTDVEVMLMLMLMQKLSSELDGCLRHTFSVAKRRNDRFVPPPPRPAQKKERKENKGSPKIVTVRALLCLDV